MVNIDSIEFFCEPKKINTKPLVLIDKLIAALIVPEYHSKKLVFNEYYIKLDQIEKYLIDTSICSSHKRLNFEVNTTINAYEDNYINVFVFCHLAFLELALYLMRKIFNNFYNRINKSEEYKEYKYCLIFIYQFLNSEHNNSYLSDTIEFYNNKNHEIYSNSRVCKSLELFLNSIVYIESTIELNTFWENQSKRILLENSILYIYNTSDNIYYYLNSSYDKSTIVRNSKLMASSKSKRLKYLLARSLDVITNNDSQFKTNDIFNNTAFLNYNLVITIKGNHCPYLYCYKIYLISNYHDENIHEYINYDIDSLCSIMNLYSYCNKDVCANNNLIRCGKGSIIVINLKNNFQVSYLYFYLQKMFRHIKLAKVNLGNLIMLNKFVMNNINKNIINIAEQTLSCNHSNLCFIAHRKNTDDTASVNTQILANYHYIAEKYKCSLETNRTVSKQDLISTNQLNNKHKYKSILMNLTELQLFCFENNFIFTLFDNQVLMNTNENHTKAQTMLKENVSTLSNYHELYGSANTIIKILSEDLIKYFKNYNLYSTVSSMCKNFFIFNFIVSFVHYYTITNNIYDDQTNEGWKKLLDFCLNNLKFEFVIDTFINLTDYTVETIQLLFFFSLKPKSLSYNVWLSQNCLDNQYQSQFKHNEYTTLIILCAINYCSQNTSIGIFENLIKSSWVYETNLQYILNIYSIFYCFIFCNINQIPYNNLFIEQELLFNKCTKIFPSTKTQLNTTEQNNSLTNDVLSSSTIEFKELAELGLQLSKHTVINSLFKLLTSKSHDKFLSDLLIDMLNHIYELEKVVKLNIKKVLCLCILLSKTIFAYKLLLLLLNTLEFIDRDSNTNFYLIIYNNISVNIQSDCMLGTRKIQVSEEYRTICTLCLLQCIKLIKIIPLNLSAYEKEIIATSTFSTLYKNDIENILFACKVLHDSNLNKFWWNIDINIILQASFSHICARNYTMTGAIAYAQIIRQLSKKIGNPLIVNKYLCNTVKFEKLTSFEGKELPPNQIGIHYSNIILFITKYLNSDDIKDYIITELVKCSPIYPSLLSKLILIIILRLEHNEGFMINLAKLLNSILNTHLSEYDTSSSFLYNSCLTLNYIIIDVIVNYIYRHICTKDKKCLHFICNIQFSRVFEVCSDDVYNFIINYIEAYDISFPNNFVLTSDFFTLPNTYNISTSSPFNNKSEIPINQNLNKVYKNNQLKKLTNHIITNIYANNSKCYQYMINYLRDILLQLTTDFQTNKIDAFKYIRLFNSLPYYVKINNSIIQGLDTIIDDWVSVSHGSMNVYELLSKSINHYNQINKKEAITINIRSVKLKPYININEALDNFSIDNILQELVESINYYSKKQEIRNADINYIYSNYLQALDILPNNYYIRYDYLTYLYDYFFEFVYSEAGKAIGFVDGKKKGLHENYFTKQIPNTIFTVNELYFSLIDTLIILLLMHDEYDTDCLLKLVNLIDLFCSDAFNNCVSNKKNKSASKLRTAHINTVLFHIKSDLNQKRLLNIVINKYLNSILEICPYKWYKIINVLISKCINTYISEVFYLPLLCSIFYIYPNQVSWKLNTIFFMENEKIKADSKLCINYLTLWAEYIKNKRIESFTENAAIFFIPMIQHITHLYPLNNNMLDYLTHFKEFFTILINIAEDTMINASSPVKTAKQYPKLWNFNFAEQKIIAPNDDTLTVKYSRYIIDFVTLSINEGFNFMSVLEPYKNSLSMPKYSTVICSDYNYNENNVFTYAKTIFITGVEKTIKIYNSKQKPKIIRFVCSNGSIKSYLLKNEFKGDMRKDTFVLEFIKLTNTYTSNIINNCTWISDTDNNNTFENYLTNKYIQARSFLVLPLKEICGFIEWLDHTIPLKNIVDLTLPSTINKLPRRKIEQSEHGNYLAAFETAVNDIPPRLHLWYSQQFGYTASTWVQAKTNFIQSYSLWCIAGFIMGLGDRHLENILVSKITGEIINVDFDCILSKGAVLPIPELVPFRFTQNIAKMFNHIEDQFCSFMEFLLVAVYKPNMTAFLTLYDAVINNSSIDHKYAYNDVSYSQSLKWKILGRCDCNTLFSDLAGTKPTYEIANSISIPTELPLWNQQYLTPKAQVKLLLRSAKDKLNLALMYVGWCSWC